VLWIFLVVVMSARKRPESLLACTCLDYAAINLEFWSNLLQIIAKKLEILYVPTSGLLPNSLIYIFRAVNFSLMMPDTAKISVIILLFQFQVSTTLLDYIKILITSAFLV